jgi:ankyrin repeat protein
MLLHHACAAGLDRAVRRCLRRTSCWLDMRDEKGNAVAHIACQSGRSDTVRALIDSPRHRLRVRRGRAGVRPVSVVDWNAVNDIGSTPLHEACQHGHVDVAKWLLVATDVDVNAVDDDGDTPLHIACRGGYARIVALLQSCHADERIQNNDGDVPLHIACASGSAPLIALLSRNRAAVEARNDWQETPLQKYMDFLTKERTVHDEQAVICSLLYAPFDATCSAVFARAVSAGWPAVVRACVELAPSIVHQDVELRCRVPLSPLHCALASGHADVASILLSAGAGAQRVPLHYFLHCPDQNVLRVMLETRFCSGGVGDLDRALEYFVADHNDSDDSSLGRRFCIEWCVAMGATWSGEFDDCRHFDDVLLLMHCLTEEQCGRFMCVATRLNRLDVVIALLDRTHLDDACAIHVAAHYGRDSIADVLIRRGCNVSLVDDHARTPLYYAARSGHLAVARALLEAGAPVDAGDGTHTPLHAACANGHAHVVRFLLASHADAAARTLDEHGHTPLHLACRSLDVVCELVLRGRADVHAQDAHGQTPMCFADEHVAFALLSFGALLDIGSIEHMIRRGVSTPALHQMMEYDEMRHEDADATDPR